MRKAIIISTETNDTAGYYKGLTVRRHNLVYVALISYWYKNEGDNHALYTTSPNDIGCYDTLDDIHRTIKNEGWAEILVNSNWLIDPYSNFYRESKRIYDQRRAAIKL